MERFTTNMMTIERKGIFDRNRKKRFELTFTCKDSKQKKSILVIGLNPASEDISIIDTTTTFILNNLIPMGYTIITICNLYGELFKQRLKPSEVPNNTENRKYLEEALERGFDTILLGYGNTFLTNKFVKEEKAYLRKLLSSYKEKVVDIVDDKGEYERLTAIHPLMAGRYFPGRWKLRPFIFEKEKEKTDDDKAPNSKERRILKKCQEKRQRPEMGSSQRKQETLQKKEKRNQMKRAIRIKTVGQWHLLKQLNGYLGKWKVPEEVMRKIYHILCSKKLGKNGFLILCLYKLKDDWYGIEEAAGMYPNKIKVEEDIDEILTRSRRGKIRSWYVSYIKMGGQRIPLIYTTKGQSAYREG